jgi:hypothetical protein
MSGVLYSIALSLYEHCDEDLVIHTHLFLSSAGYERLRLHTTTNFDDPFNSIMLHEDEGTRAGSVGSNRAFKLINSPFAP